jgi:hypothetical protein
MENKNDFSSGTPKNSNDPPEEPEVFPLEEAIDEIKEPPKTVTPRKLIHAYNLARIIVWTFALSVGCCFLYIFFFKSTFQNGVDLFKTVSAILSGPLGFVLGYYFRITESGS